MPDMTGLSVVTAQMELARVGIKTASPTYIDTSVPLAGSGDAPPKMPVRPGAVIAQSPAAGSRVDQSTMVNLTVAR
jgi:beta-lactam-binding protein with PASTA domain